MSWDWQVFCRNTIDGEVVARCLGSGGDITYLDWMLSAWGWTLSVSLLALAVALVFGVVVGILRTLPQRGLVLAGDAWTELFRNIPVLVQVFLWYFVAPELVPALKQIPSFLLGPGAGADFAPDLPPCAAAGGHAHRDPAVDQ